MKIKKIISGLILIIALAGLGVITAACDSTDLEGTIIPSPVEAKVADEIVITLEVPAELREIHREMWQVEPESLGTITCTETGDNCRQATFTAVSPGEGTIEVWGFYKQTNPQFITEVEVRVTE